MTGWEKTEESLQRKTAKESHAIEANYRLINENMKDVVWQTTPDLVITYVTSSVKKLLGYEPQELIGQPLTYLLKPAAKKLVLDLYPDIMRRLAEHEELDCEIPIVELIRKDGTTVWTEVDTHPTFNSAGQFTGFKGVAWDISKRKKAEDALRESERFLRQSEKIARTGGWMANPHTNSLHWTQGVYDIVGAPKDYQPGLDEGLEFYTPSYRPILKEAVAKTIEQGEPFTIEAEVMTTGGKHLWTEVRGLMRLEVGEAPQVIGSFQDITERKLAEELLQQSEEKFSKVFQYGPALITLSNLDDGTYVDVNDKFCEVSGFSRADCIGKTAIDFGWISQEERKRLFDELHAHGSARGIDLEVRTKDKRKLHLIYNGEMIQTKNRPLLLSIAHNITDRKIVEEELREARDELEARVEERTNNLVKVNQNLELEIADRKRAEKELQGSLQRLELTLAEASRFRVQAEVASAAKSEFLTNMSHELRTPLTAVIGFSDLLGDQIFGKLNDKQLGYVKEISGAGRHLLILINDILDLAKVESGKMDIRMSPVDLTELLEHCLRMIRETAIKRGLNVSLKVSEEFYEGQIQADNVRLKQIVMNLLSNAVKFTPSGGTIRLEAERRGKEILLSVSDTGLGLKPDDQKRIFQAFEQLDGSFSRQEQGTGLGLALVSKLVELHGGRFLVESDGEGLGSTFSFFIPFIREAKDAESQLAPASVRLKFQSPPDPSVAEKTRPKVLVVEDNESNMKFITDLLEDAGYEAIHAFSAETAIEQTEMAKPSLILMDISLPGMDGLTATKVLKSNPVTAHIPVVALTAHAMKDDESKAKEAGCDAYLLKPIDTRVFYRTLADIVREPPILD